MIYSRLFEWNVLVKNQERREKYRMCKKNVKRMTEESKERDEDF